MGWVKRRFMTFILVLSMTLPLSVSTPVEVSASQDYLSITLADIIIAWYNASGVAIGDTNIANAIYSAYSGITLADLADHDCLTALDGIYAPGSVEMRAYVKELIGYGNLTVPMINVRVTKLQEYLGELPASNVAKESLEAMFGWEGNLWNEAMFGLLGGVIGSVANTGKLAYNVAANTLTDISDTVKNSYLGKTLLDVYRHFTDSTYFQDLLASGGGSGSGSIPSAGPYTFSSGFPYGAGYDGVAIFVDNTNKVHCVFVNEDVVGTFGRNVRFASRSYIGAVNISGQDAHIEYCLNLDVSPDNVLSFGSGSSHGSLNVFSGNNTNAQAFTSNRWDGATVYGYGLIWWSDMGLDYVVANNPWDSPVVVPPGDSVTNYINNSVGNIASDNYINLSPNIGSDEYMYIFDRPTYIETLNQITDNTDNGDYSTNSTVINNFNNTYVEEPSYVTVRPSTAPADPEQPAQPFISPRPTQAPEALESVIYEGGISEDITKKFPFCIPWDIKAMIDRLWTPESRAPYIHWDATFGSWGKLGEVDIDLQDFNGAAAIFRSTTLLLWIVGLVLITRDLLG